MRVRALLHVVRRDLRRSVRTFAVASLGIAVGIATLAFFLALGVGMKEIVLGRIFPIDRLEVAPQEASVGAVASLLGSDRPAGITPDTVAQLRRIPGVTAVYPKMRLVFPSSGRGGRALFGRDVGTGEIVADGIDAAQVQSDLAPGTRFVDTLAQATQRPCTLDAECAAAGEFCDMRLTPDGGHPIFPGACAPPIPAVISPYLVEVFNGAIAPAHHLPTLSPSILHATEGLVLEWDLGRAGLGMARQGVQRRAHVRVVGVSARAIDLGFTVPLAVARRLNAEYAGAEAAGLYTSASVQLRHPSDTSTVTAGVRALGLEVKTSGAEQMGLLVAVITAILSLTSVVVVIVASLNIAHVFFTMIAERRGEIGLYRALGATRSDVRWMVIAQAAVVGLVASGAGALLARAAALGADHLAATKLPPFPFKPEHWFVFNAAGTVAVLTFGLLACVLSALAPAARAARVEPSTALAGGV